MRRRYGLAGGEPISFKEGYVKLANNHARGAQETYFPMNVNGGCNYIEKTGVSEGAVQSAQPNFNDLTTAQRFSGVREYSTVKLAGWLKRKDKK